jgi:hypothetical protein
MTAAHRLPWLAAAFLGAVFALLVAGQAKAVDQFSVSVETWTSDLGHGYVGVQASGEWAVPASSACRRYYSRWNHGATILTDPLRDEWWVTVFTCDGTAVNPLSPTMVITSRTNPGIGIRRQASGLLRLDLGVAVEPVTAPAGTLRTVTAALSGAWWDAIGDEISAYVIRSSVRVESWTVDFGDGTTATAAPDAAAPYAFSMTHRYGEGEFEVTVTAHVTGDAYGAFFSSEAVPAERTVAFRIDITNSASGVSALPIEYLPPLVVPGGSPSGVLPAGPIPPDVDGHARLWWPRGLPCDLYVRAIVEREGFMRSGGLVIGGATTRLVRYRYLGGTNDASGATPPGTYDTASPIRIGWNTPLPNGGAYPIGVELTVETTYDDGTVRTYQFSGSIAGVVVYSAISH